jgi:ABC-type transport system involved in multi-copper enzyme maturation permease subunit
MLFCAVFLCVILLMMTPLMGMKATAASQAQGAMMVLGLVSAIMSMLTGFGSLLAAWSAADVVAAEMKSGTILAVMARPVRRWEFLLGKYLGVQILMLTYVLAMFGMSYVLAWIGDARIQTTPWVLIVYPIVRYAIYTSLAILLVTLMHPVFAFVIVLVTGVVASELDPGSHFAHLPEPVQKVLYVILPSTNLLSESNFLSITETSLKRMAWTDHLLALSYGLDYALVCFLLAVWSFRYRSLTRD